MTEAGETAKRLTYKGTADDLAAILLCHAKSPHFIDYKENAKKPDVQKLRISYLNVSQGSK
jgi:hypothetical protein